MFYCLIKTYVLKLIFAQPTITHPSMDVDTIKNKNIKFIPILSLIYIYGEHTDKRLNIIQEEIY